MERYKLCPGSHLFCLSVPEPPPETYTLNGTVVHAALAGELSESELDEDQQATVAALKDREELVRETLNLKNALWLRERRLWAKDESYSGRFDLIGLSGDEAAIIDYKSGRSETSPSWSNLQLRAGAALLKDKCPNLTKISVAIVSPHALSYNIALYDETRIAKAKAHIERIVRATEDPDAPRVPGDEQCRWCRGKDACPEYNARISRSVAALTPYEASEVPAENYTTKQWTDFLSVSTQLKQWIEAKRRQAVEVVKRNPEDFPSFRVVSFKRVKAANPGALFLHALSCGVAVEKLADCITGISLTQVKSLTKEPAPEELIAEFEQEYVAAKRERAKRPSLESEVSA